MPPCGTCNTVTGSLLNVPCLLRDDQSNDRPSAALQHVPGLDLDMLRFMCDYLTIEPDPALQNQPFYFTVCRRKPTEPYKTSLTYRTPPTFHVNPDSRM